jgi:hypothetical protein
MEQLATAAFLRLTGRAFFKPDGETSQIDLGNCDALKLDFNPKRKQHYLTIHGKQVLNRDDAYGADPKWQITVDVFYSPMLPYLYGAALGAANTDISQSAATASTFTFTSKKGRTFDIGKYKLSVASVTTPTTKTEGITADYVIDRVKGKIYIPLASSIADATSVVVTFDCAALSFDSVTAFGQFNFSGTLEIQTEDEYDNAPREVYSMACNLSIDNLGETKVDDYRKVVFIATSTSGTMAFKGRKS